MGWKWALILSGSFFVVLALGLSLLPRPRGQVKWDQARRVYGEDRRQNHPQATLSEQKPWMCK